MLASCPRPPSSPRRRQSHRRLPPPTPAAVRTALAGAAGRCRACPAAIRPYPPTPRIPYHHPMPTHTRHLVVPVTPIVAGEPRRFPPPVSAAAQRCKMRVQGLPCLFRGPFTRPLSPIWTLFRGCFARPLSPICAARFQPPIAKQPPSWVLSPRAIQEDESKLRPIPTRNNRESTSKLFRRPAA